jgi:hypothetical protein
MSAQAQTTDPIEAQVAEEAAARWEAKLNAANAAGNAAHAELNRLLRDHLPADLAERAIILANTAALQNWREGGFLANYSAAKVQAQYARAAAAATED